MRTFSFGRKLVCFVLAFVFLFSHAPVSFADVAPSASEDVFYPAWIEAGGKIGDDRQLGTTDFFLPVYQDPDQLWFTDLRWKDANGPEAEWNVGLGHRSLMGPEGDKQWILGFYGYFDQLRSEHRNYFGQGAFGVEALTKDWDLRVNGYFPDGKREFISESFDNGSVFISGNTIGTFSDRTEIREVALPGFDAEIGFKLPIPVHDIRIFAGGFYFDRSGVDEVAGPRARTEWRIEDPFGWKGVRITVDGEYSHDDVRESEYFVGATVRIPLDFRFTPPAGERPLPGIVTMHPADSLQRRMIEPIVRDVDVITGLTESTSQISGPAINPFTGRPYSGIFFAEETGTGVGTETDPDDLAGATGSAGVDGVVAALDTNGTINEAAALANGMVLIGGGGILPVQTLEGVNTSLVIPGGGPATINDGGTVVTLADQNMVFYVTLTGGGDGINGSGVMSPWINNVTANGLGDDGIELDGLTGDLLIENSSFDNNGNDGINIDTVTGNVTILNTTADGNGNDGLVVGNVTGNVFVDPSSFSGNLASGGEDTGVYIYTIVGNVTLLDLTITGNTGTGLLIDDVTGNVLVQNSVISGNSNYGIEIYDVNGNTTLKGITANDNSQSNLYIDQNGFTGNVLIDPSSFNRSVNGYGLEIYNVDGNTTLVDVTANDNNQSNLYIDQNGYEGDLTIRRSEFNRSVNGNGLEIYNVFGDTTITDVNADDNNQTNLYIDQNGYTGNVLIDPSSFSNSVNGYGLEIYNVDGNTTLLDVTANDNNQSNLYIDQNGYEGDLTIRRSEFNRSVNGNGLEIYNVFGDTTITDVNADDNNQTNLYIDQNGYTGNVLIDPSSFSRSVNNRGVEIYNVDGNVTLIDVTANDNNQSNLYIDQNGYEGDLTIRNSEFNRSVNDNGLEIYDVFGDITITDVNANDNNQTNLYIDQDGYAGNVLIDPSSFSRSVNDRGVDIQNVDGNVTLEDVTANDNNNRNINIDDVSGNVLLDNVSGDGSDNARGVGINAIGGDVTIEDSNFNNNQGTNITIGNTSGIGGSVIIRNTTANNSLGFRGIDINDVANDVTLQNVTADDNNGNNLEITNVGGNVFIDPSSFSRSVNGAGIFIESITGDVTLEDVTADDNSARNIYMQTIGGNVLLDNVSADGSQSGRGFRVGDVGGDVTILDSNFNGNNVSNVNIGGGAGGSIGGSVVIRDTTANDSVNGRGIVINDIANDVTLQNVTASGNFNTNLDISSVGGNVFIDPSQFNNSQNGDGIFVNSGGSDLTFEDVTALNNNSTDINLSSYNSYSFTNVTYGSLND